MGEALAASGWRSILTRAQRPECDAFAQAFADAARAAGRETIEGRVFARLADLTGMVLNLEDSTEAFTAAFMDFTSGRRSAVPDDFTNAELDDLTTLLGAVGDPELKARIGDLLWVRRRDHKAALAAVEAYLASAARLEDPEDWVACAERIQRALQLATMLRNEAAIAQVVGHIESTLDHYGGKDSSYLTARLLELLLQARRGDHAKLAQAAADAAEHAASKQDGRRAAMLWDLAARAADLVEGAPRVREFRVRQAEVFIGEADRAPNAMLRATHLEAAIQALRRVGGEKQRVQELQRQLHDAQQDTFASLKRIEATERLRLDPALARRAVSGLPKLRALVRLATITGIPRVQDFEPLIAELRTKAPLRALLPKTVVNTTGKVVARIPAHGSEDAAEQEASIQAELNWHAGLQVQLDAIGSINPAREQFQCEHRLAMHELHVLLVGNPFVPPGHERTLARGLHAGFRGDFPAAASILIPQLEACLRHVLSERGAVVTGLNDEGIQEEHGLPRLLKLPQFTESFGEDLAMLLEGLLIARHSANLRHRLAHGLLEDDLLEGPLAVYVWWLVLRLCLWPVAQRLAAEADRTTAQPVDGSKGEEGRTAG